MTIYERIQERRRQGRALRGQAWAQETTSIPDMTPAEAAAIRRAVHWGEWPGTESSRESVARHGYAEEHPNVDLPSDVLGGEHIHLTIRWQSDGGRILCWPPLGFKQVGRTRIVGGFSINDYQKVAAGMAGSPSPDADAHVESRLSLPASWEIDARVQV